jgi:hypothetical protein
MKRQHRMLLKYQFFGIIAALLALVLIKGAVPVRSAPTVILTVNDTSDLNDETPGDGLCDTSSTTAGNQCSLRAAIQEVNAQGASISPYHIDFNIPGSGPFVISPATALPTIAVPVSINGESQSGAACTSAGSLANLQIVLEGSNAGSGASGLILGLGSDSSILRGMVIGNFDASGLQIQSDMNTVGCMYIGIGANGVTDIGNGLYGIAIANGNSNFIGGESTIAQRNVISNNWFGIRIDGGIDNEIKDNFIGTTANGRSAAGNSYGIYISTAGNTIGSTTPLGHNLISGNIGPGIRLNSAQYNILYGNYIGLASDGSTPLPNQGDGIEVLGDSYYNTIGDTGSSEGNHIAYNGYYGIALQENVSGNPVLNQIRGNAIFGNGQLGIDLGLDGVDVNDAGDADSGENNHQNYPVLQTMAGSPAITVTLDSQANATYSIDFYRNDSCDPSVYGEGQEYLIKGMTLTSDVSGHAEGIYIPGSKVAPGDHITAIAIADGGDSSEFSACVTLTFSPTPTDTATFTATPTATVTPTPSQTPTTEASSTASPTPTPTPEGTPTPPSSPPPDAQLYLPILR